MPITTSSSTSVNPRRTNFRRLQPRPMSATSSPSRFVIMSTSLFLTEKWQMTSIAVFYKTIAEVSIFFLKPHKALLLQELLRASISTLPTSNSPSRHRREFCRPSLTAKPVELTPSPTATPNNPPPNMTSASSAHSPHVHPGTRYSPAKRHLMEIRIPRGIQHQLKPLPVPQQHHPAGGQLHRAHRHRIPKAQE